MRRDGEATNLILRDLSEIIGVLRDVNSEGLTLRCAGRDIRIPAPPNLRRRAATLVGKRVAILRVGPIIYLREIKDSNSTDREAFTSEGTMEVACPPKASRR